MGVMTTEPAPIEVRGLTMKYDSFVVMRELSFEVRRGEIFVIMGGSGSGKSTLLKHLIGLRRPDEGEILFEGEDFGGADEATRKRMLRRMGVLYQNGALWSGMTLAENVALPLQEYTSLNAEAIAEVVSLKLALVGLGGFESLYPSEISGGMRKRAALARAMALDPEILFFDEPSAGLDPVSSRRLDELIVELSESMKTTVVVVTHELASIFSVARRCAYLDADSRTLLEVGDPHVMKTHSPHANVRSFLNRGEPA
jgi:phospholipid/cholesterol/gamma-HCH transport system ATP-binding protein